MKGKIFLLIFLIFISFNFIQANMIILREPTSDFPGAKLYYNSSNLGKIPILLVHGWSNNVDGSEGNWGDLEDELKNNNYGIYKLEYYPANMSNRKNAYLVSKAIENITQLTNRNKVNVISHSMGGLAVRGYIQNMSISPQGLSRKYYQNNIDKYVIIASPLYGSYFANLIDGSTNNIDLVLQDCKNFMINYNLGGNTEATKDMEIGSDFIWELNNNQINEEIKYLTISAFVDPTDLGNPLIYQLGVPECVKNNGEINDGVVSLINSNIIKYNQQSVLLRDFHINLGGGIGFRGISNIQDTGEITNLFFQAYSNLTIPDDAIPVEKYINSKIL